jgi:hypothetical protein
MIDRMRFQLSTDSPAESSLGWGLGVARSPDGAKSKISLTRGASLKKVPARHVAAGRWWTAGRVAVSQQVFGAIDGAVVEGCADALIASVSAQAWKKISPCNGAKKYRCIAGSACYRHISLAILADAFLVHLKRRR